LQRTLRFAGRFEFIGAVNEEDQGSRTYEALDFGTRTDEIPDGRAVVIKCYASDDLYEQEVRLPNIVIAVAL
jgi:hypothetical protein